MKRSACLHLIMILGLAGAFGVTCSSRWALDPDQEAAYHSCQLYQEVRYLFFEEDARHRVSRLLIDPMIPRSAWNAVIDYKFLASLPDLRELSVSSHFISNRQLNMLSNIEGLQLLDLRGCEGFSEFTLKEFQRKRPDVRILLGQKLRSLYQLPLSERRIAPVINEWTIAGRPPQELPQKAMDAAKGANASP
jgi:hypothetical protein